MSRDDIRYDPDTGVTPELIGRAVALLREAGSPRKIILFGSHARGDARRQSDADLLVVQDRIGDFAADWSKLRRALSPLRIPVDLILTTSEAFEERRKWLNSLYSRADREGRVLYEAA